MANKIGDAKVRISSYVDSNGQTKNRWADLGPVFKNDKGGFSILANPYINLAGLPRAEGKDYVTISIFPPKSDNGYQSGSYNNNLYRDNGGAQGNTGNINPEPYDPNSGDIPF